MNITRIAEIATIISTILSFISLIISFKTLNEVKNISIEINNGEMQNNQLGFNMLSKVEQKNVKN